MAKKAQAGTAKKAKATKKAVSRNVVAKTAIQKRKKARVGRTTGRAARGADKIKTAVKKVAPGARGNRKPKIDPEVEAARARNRALWKSQAQEANSVELAKQSALVDERARARSTMGMSWSNRKPR